MVHHREDMVLTLPTELWASCVHVYFHTTNWTVYTWVSVMFCTDIRCEMGKRKFKNQERRKYAVTSLVVSILLQDIFLFWFQLPSVNSAPPWLCHCRLTVLPLLLLQTWPHCSPDLWHWKHYHQTGFMQAHLGDLSSGLPDALSPYTRPKPDFSWKTDVCRDPWRLHMDFECKLHRLPTVLWSAQKFPSYHEITSCCQGK